MLLVFLSQLVYGQEKVSSGLNLNYSLVHYNDTIGHVRQIDIKVTSPIWQSTKSRLSGTLSYNNVSLNDFPAVFGADLQGLSFGLNWTGIINPNEALIIFGQAGIYSDMKNLSSDALRERLGFIYLNKHSDRFSLGLGLSYGKQFYGNQLIPVIAVIYHFDNEHWRLSGAFPESPKLTYNLSGRSALNLQISEQFASYRLTAAGDSGAFIKDTKVTSLFTYEYKFSKLCSLAAGVGYNMRQKYELYKDGDSSQWYFINTPIGNKPMPVTSIVHNGLQFHIGLAFNPPF